MRKFWIALLAAFFVIAPASAQAVTLPLPTITVPGPAITLPGVTVTVPGPTVQVPGPTVRVPGPTVTVPGATVTETVTVPGNPGGVTTVTSTIPGQNITSTAPGSTQTDTSTVTVGPSGGPVVQPSATMDAEPSERVRVVTRTVGVSLGLVLLGAVAAIIGLAVMYRLGYDEGETQMGRFLRGVIKQK